MPVRHPSPTPKNVGTFPKALSQRTTKSRISVDLDVLVTVVARAIEVFGTRDKAVDWLRTPLPALSHRTPISIMNTSAGVEQIEDVLGRIEHGVW